MHGAFLDQHEANTDPLMTVLPICAGGQPALCSADIGGSCSFSDFLVKFAQIFTKTPDKRSGLNCLTMRKICQKA